MRAVPRLVIAGAASGVGKTTVMVGLLEALRARGLRVAAFKCGPDFLDPGYHARAAGAPSHTLDGWMMGQSAALATFARATVGADVALVEGMMGLYDGVAPESDEGSAAELSRWLAAPVVAVLDVSAMARTAAAVGHGLATFHPGVRVAALFGNRVGGEAHLALLRAACREVPMVGGLPRVEALAFPERHLGLLRADEIDGARLAGWGPLMEKWGGVDELLRIARSAPPLDLEPAPSPPSPAHATPPSRTAAKCRIAVARDAALHFYYEDNLQRLRQLGAELVPFSPLADAALPDADGLYLGGGYPEAHAEALAANRPLRASVAAFAERGRPVYAECGGLMYLSRALVTLDGQTHEMVGLVDGIAVMKPSLQALGYVEVETRRATPLGPAGVRLRGHQFRHSTLEGPAGDAYALRRPGRDETQLEGYGRGNVLASYVHAHWGRLSQAAEGFVAACCR